MTMRRQSLCAVRFAWWLAPSPAYAGGLITLNGSTTATVMIQPTDEHFSGQCQTKRFAESLW
jgi:hypothetical protein